MKENPAVLMNGTAASFTSHFSSFPTHVALAAIYLLQKQAILNRYVSSFKSLKVNHLSNMVIDVGKNLENN